MFNKFEQRIIVEEKKTKKEESTYIENMKNNDIIRFILGIGLIESDDIEQAYNELLPIYREMIDKTGLYGLTTLNRHLSYVKRQVDRNDYEIVKKVGYLKSSAKQFMYKIDKGYYNANLVERNNEINKNIFNENN